MIVLCALTLSLLFATPPAQAGLAARAGPHAPTRSDRREGPRECRRALTLHLEDADRERSARAVTVSGARPGAAVCFVLGTRVRSALDPLGRPGLDLADGEPVHVTFADESGAASCPAHLLRGSRSAAPGASRFVQAVSLPAPSDRGEVVLSNLIGMPKNGGSGIEGERVPWAPPELEGSSPNQGLSSILDVDGVRRWYDPELSDYTAGVLEDLAGNAPLVQPSTGSRPIWNPAGLNGKPSLCFDGSDDYLFNATPLLASLDQFTLIMIAKAPSGQIDKRLVAEGSSTTDVPLFVPLRTGSNTRTTSPSQLIRNDANQFLFQDSTGPVVFDDGVHFFGVSVDRLAGTVTNFEDIELDDPDAYPAEGAVSVNRFALGAMVRTSVQFHFAGEVGPVIVVDRVLPKSELRRIREYYETRGYLGPYQKDPIFSAVPPGYTLVYEEDFDGYASVDELIEDGLAPTQGKPFADCFVTFGVRFLTGNNDRCYKALGTNPGNGATALESLMGTKPHELVDDNLRLRLAELPMASWPAFSNRQHGGGMISSERGFAHGPGLFEVRLRSLNTPPGGHFALWLLTQNTSPHEVEIDMLELVGNNLISKDKPVNVLFFAGHDLEHVPPQHAAQTNEQVSNYVLNQWHVYSFLYTPTQFTWYRDGVVVRQEDAYYSGSAPLYFLATWESNFNTAKNFPGPSQGNAPMYPGEIEIDYLRVYAPPSPQLPAVPTANGRR